MRPRVVAASTLTYTCYAGLHPRCSAKMDVVCIQEPFTFPGSKTQNHPGYDCYAPVDSWDSTEPDQREEERPRVMTYIRKGAGLKTQQRCPIGSRDMLWIDINGFAILNIYRQPLQPQVLDYVTHLSPPPSPLIGGDFNAWNDMFEPGVQPKHQGAELARWSSESNMDFIGTPGDPTQRSGHVLDLTFSNIPFAQSPDAARTIPDSDLPKFAGLIQNGIASLTPLNNTLAEVFNTTIHAVGIPDR